MTGAYVRVQRQGHWQNVEIEQLTPAEVDALAAEQGVERGGVWAAFLVDWIRQHVQGLEPDELVTLEDIAQACHEQERRLRLVPDDGWRYTRVLILWLQLHVQERGEEEGDDAS